MSILLAAARPESFLFWSAPVADSEFSPEDPLALDYIAQQVGLFLLPALTTRSSRAQSYAVVLYGLQLAEKALSRYGLPDDDEIRRRLFERWERFWAMAVLESRRGVVQRGDPDAMRGIRGAVRAWFDGEKSLPLDYPLISRQQELGSLGAYLAPLRASRLVTPGTLRPSPAAEEILCAFWNEPEEGSHASRFDEYALEALDFGRARLERKYRNLTLATVGERSRLSSLYGKRPRVAQQGRLYCALFERARDATTLPVARIVEAASREGVVSSRDILDAALAERWGSLDSSLADLFLTARRFGDVMQEVLAAFDRAYVRLAEAGWQAKRSEVAAAAFPSEVQARLRTTCLAFLGAPEIGRILRLPMHGGPFIQLVEGLRQASQAEALDRLLAYHLGVQRERRRGDGWMRDQADRVVVQLTSYNPRPDVDRYPSFKFGVVRQLLRDVGRLPRSNLATAEETA
jgi:hypothetical protein